MHLTKDEHMEYTGSSRTPPQQNNVTWKLTCVSKQ